MVLQQIIDSDVQCGSEGLQAGVHEIAVLPSTYADSPHPFDLLIQSSGTTLRLW